MQEELRKHTKNIFTAANNKEHSFLEKSKEIIIEISIIVFAVSFSIWLHSWIEHKHQQDEAKEFLIDLKIDLESDLKRTKNDIGFLKSLKLNYEVIGSGDQRRMDSLNMAKRYTAIYTINSFASRSNANFEGFKSSGKLGYIENKKLKRNIVNYYQNISPTLDSNYNDYQTKTDYIQDYMNLNKKSLSDDYIKSYCSMLGLKIGFYLENFQKAEKNINEIINEINMEATPE